MIIRHLGEKGYVVVNVFLDDTRKRPEGFLLATNVEKCIELINTRKINILSLDYNLGFGQPTGYEVVQFLVREKLYPRKIIIHSANPFGRWRMLRLLMQHKPEQVQVYVRPLPIA